MADPSSKTPIDTTRHSVHPPITAVNSGGRCITFDEDCGFSLWRLVMRRLSEAEKSEIWDRFEAGESQRSISPGVPPSGRTRQRTQRRQGVSSEPTATTNHRADGKDLSR